MICVLLTGRKLVCQTGAMLGPFNAAGPGLLGLWWGSTITGSDEWAGGRKEEGGRKAR